MGKRSRKRAPGSTKPRPAPQPRRSANVQAEPQGLFGRVKQSWDVAGQRPAKHGVGTSGVRGGKRERPPGLFGPVPVSEIAILAGIVALIIGFAKGASDGSKLITVGVVLAALGSLEFSLREHLYGYRSHTLLLTLVPVVLVHALVTVIGGGTTGRNPILLAVDVALAVSLYFWLQRLYRDSRSRAR